MARTHDPSIRAALRERAVDHVLDRGLVGLSLRPMANALGTNARMLVYHFGSREGLMREVLAGLREREDRQVRQWFARGRRPRTLRQFVLWYWDRMTSDAARPAVLLIFELYALALRDPEGYPGVLEEPLVYWRTLLERAGIPADVRSSRLATILLASIRGLLLDVAATGGRRRARRALVTLLDSLELRK